MDKTPIFKLGTLYSGSSMMKKDFLYFIPVTAFTKSAPRRIKRIPTKYITGPTHFDSGKKAPVNNADYRKFCSTWHKGCQHCCCSTFSFVTDGTASHNSRDTTSCSDDHRNYGFTGKTYTFEDRIQYDSCTSHISTIFQKGDEEIHNHYQWKETYYGTYTTDYTINKQGIQERICIFKQSAYPFLERLNPSRSGYLPDRYQVLSVI